MQPDDPTIPHLRLCDAADACLQVWENSDCSLLPTDAKRQPHEPDILREFTRDEVIAGTAFLMRLGYIPSAASDQD